MSYEELMAKAAAGLCLRCHRTEGCDDGSDGLDRGFPCKRPSESTTFTNERRPEIATENRWTAFTNEELHEIDSGLRASYNESQEIDGELRQRLTEELTAERRRRELDIFWEKRDAATPPSQLS